MFYQADPEGRPGSAASRSKTFPASPNPPAKSFSFLFCALQINCVTFPHPDTMPEQQLLKPTEWSYCDYFWVSGASVSPTLWPQGPEVNTQEGHEGPQAQRRGDPLVIPKGLAVDLASEAGT